MIKKIFSKMVAGKLREKKDTMLTKNENILAEDEKYRQAAITFPEKVLRQKGGLYHFLNKPFDDFRFVDKIMARFAACFFHLRLSPKAKILDFGSGPGWITEWLTRLDFDTISYDISFDFLKIGRQRLKLDERTKKKRAKFVAGDGEKLPFKSESFDGIFCFDTLHHLPNYHLVLEEMFRVLAQGGRAVFSEPGKGHSQSREALRDGEIYGTLEKDVIMEEIMKIAQKVGFEKCFVIPFDFLNAFDYFSKWQDLKGSFSLREQYMKWLINQGENIAPTFVLFKGYSTYTSLSPHILKAEIKVISPLDEVVTREDFFEKRFKVKIKNIGDTVWLHRNFSPSFFNNEKGVVKVGMILLDENGNPVSFGRVNLDCDILPGEEFETEIPLFVFSEAPPGNYSLIVDLVDELITWFKDVGSQVVSQNLKIVSRK